MRRYEAIKLIMEQVTDEFVICNLGHPSQELFRIKDRPRNFYMLGSMGLASSIGLGLAMSQPEKDVVIDGEGSVLMNLGTLTTIGINQPANLRLFIIDNEAYGSTGFQPSFTSLGVDIAEIARSCGIRNTFICRQEEECRRHIPRVLNQVSGTSCTVIKTEKGMPENLKPIPHSATHLKKRFMESINAGRKSKNPDKESL